DAPDVESTRARLGAAGDKPLMQVMKTIHTAHGGKLSIARVLAGKVADGKEVTSSSGSTGKISGLYRMLGKEQVKLATAEEGETVALGKLEAIATGETLAANGAVAPLVVL